MSRDPFGEDMYDVDGEDFDPITALATLNGATEKYAEAKKIAEAAEEALSAAHSYLNHVQKQFDKVVAHLHVHAPAGSYWDHMY